MSINIATLYDSSLDQFYPHSWNQFNFFSSGYETIYSTFANRALNLQTVRDDWNHYHSIPGITYTHFPASLAQANMYYGSKRKGLMMDKMDAEG